MEIRIAHSLDPDDVAQRILDAASEIDVEVDVSPDKRSGSLQKDTPLGAVQGRYEVEETEVVVHIEKRPAWAPENTIRRLLEEGLSKALRT